MSIVFKNELTTSLTTPKNNKINLFYNNSSIMFGFKKSNGDIITLNEPISGSISMSNTGSGIGIFSGSTISTAIVNFSFFKLRHLGISGTLSNSNNTIIVYGSRNTFNFSSKGIGLSIYSGSNNNTFNFFTITGASDNTTITLNDNTLYISTSITGTVVVQSESFILTESFYIPDPFSLVTSSIMRFPSGNVPAYGTPFPINGVIYTFGGSDGSKATDRIYYASMSNPTSWSQTNAGTFMYFGGKQQAIIGNKIYAFGGSSGSYIGKRDILTASVNNPLDWGNSNILIPGNTRVASVLYVSKETNKIILYGGYDYSNWLNTIITASIYEPLDWGTALTTLPAARASMCILEAGEWIYFLHGDSSGSIATNTIWRAHKSNPTVVIDTGLTTPFTSNGNPYAPSIQIGEYYYFWGLSGQTSSYRIHVEKPWEFETISRNLSFNFNGTPTNSFLNYIVNNKLFVWNGGAVAMTSSQLITCSTIIPSSSLYQNVPSIRNDNYMPTIYAGTHKFGSDVLFQTDFDR
jgi:hypothetical protein